MEGRAEVMDKSPEERAGEWIARAMATANVSRKELHERTGITAPTICNLINSKHDVRMSVFLRLVEACGVEYDFVITGAKENYAKAQRA